MGVNKKRILMIYDSEKFTEEMVKDDMRSEEFSHYFKFANGVTDLDELESYVAESDEVWVFGDVKETVAFRVATEFGKEIWVMG